MNARTVAAECGRADSIEGGAFRLGTAGKELGAARFDDFKGMRIVAMTGSGREDDRQAAWEAGIDQYLLKPIDLEFVRSLLG